MTWSTLSGSALSGTMTESLEPCTRTMVMASGWAKVSKEGWNPYLQTKVCTVPGKTGVFKGGEKNPGDVEEDYVSVATSQSLATRVFICE